MMSSKTSAPAARSTLAVVLIAIFHQSANEVALIMLIVSVLTMVISGVPALRWEIEHHDEAASPLS